LKSKDYFDKLFAEIKALPAWFKDEDIEDCFFLLSASRPGGQHRFHARMPEHFRPDEFVQPALDYLGQKVPHIGKKPEFKSVEFVSRLALGDAMMMTCGIRDFKAAFPDVKVKVKSTAMHVWDNNPNIDQTIIPEKTFNCGTAWLTNASNRLNLHMANAYRMSIQNETGLVFEQGPIRPDIWLSEEEYKAEPLIPGPYWVIVKGGEIGWPLKMYPIEGWQAVVDALPQIKFVELGTEEHIRAHGRLENHKGNLVQMVGKTQDRDKGIRDLFKIFLHAQGSVGLISMHMHLSAAFDNPCVVVAGAREPAWFTQYFGHIYLHSNGLLPCAEKRACWHCDTPTCKNLIEGTIVPKCVDLIKPQEIVSSILKYYEGGRLEFDKKKPNTFFRGVTGKGVPRAVLSDVKTVGPLVPIPKKPRVDPDNLIKILTSCVGYGGSEKSTLHLMKLFLDEGYDVQLCPWGGMDKIGKAYKAGIPEKVYINPDIVGECKALVYYTTDTIYHHDFNRPELAKHMLSLRAKRKVMVLNYHLGNAGKFPWTKGWDRYGFLCSQKQEEFQNRLPEADTFVLAPPTDLTAFFAVDRTYTKKLKLIRHNAQGDAKWPKTINDFLSKVWGIDKKITWTCMPAASFMLEDDRITKYRVNELPIPEFLLQGNCFIYNLPDRYQDQGPRVILEAQASGLAVIADNQWGAKDRVSNETGWLCDNEADYLQAIADIVSLPSLLRTKGQRARKLALKDYDPHRWIEEILK